MRVTAVGTISGIDMAGALAMARAMGVDDRLAAEMLPAIEAGLVKAINQKLDGGEQ